MAENKKANCIRCKQYVITWDTAFPMGCKLYGFKTRKLPSLLVLESTGKPCEHCEVNPVKG